MNQVHSNSENDRNKFLNNSPNNIEKQDEKNDPSDDNTINLTQNQISQDLPRSNYDLSNQSVFSNSIASEMSQEFRKEVVTSESLARVDKPEIQERMDKEGFLEMRLLWDSFLKRGKEISILDNQVIEHARLLHTCPLFGRAKLFGAAGAGLAMLVTNYFLPHYELLFNHRPKDGGFYTLFGAAFLGLHVGVGGMGLIANALQRRVIYPMSRIMSDDLAFMLSHRSFRSWHALTENAIGVMNKIREKGGNDKWDDNQYQVRYQIVDRRVEVVNLRAANEIVLDGLRQVIGYFDNAERRYVSGKYSANLVDGKKSVNNFLKECAEQIALFKTNRLDLQGCIHLLSILRDNFVKPASTASNFLNLLIEELRDPANIKQSQVQAKIWERDPWVDLTHQLEFFSSASLRGGKFIGGGDKGRLGTFGYLRNKSISALDFTTPKGRIVRARLAAAIEKNSDQLVLYVDGVEGSNSVAPQIIVQAIDDYAKAVGFKLVAYNAYVHNKVPQRIVKYLADSGNPLKQIDIEYIDSSQPEYLDAFGCMLQPFEYRSPKGKIVTYVRNISNDSLSELHEPSKMVRAGAWIKKNILNILVTEIVACQALMLSHLNFSNMISIPDIKTGILSGVLIGLISLGIAAGYYNMRYQNKAIRES